MLLALAVTVALADWVPARWGSNDPATLDLVAKTPINCLLLEQPLWSPEFARAAADVAIATVGVVRAPVDAPAAAARAKAAGLTAVLLEGDFDPGAAEAVRSIIPAIEMPSRARLRLDADQTVVATGQGVWPGIEVEEEGSSKAAPSGAPWIHTNTGFLRFLRASTGAAVWIGNRPPEKQVIPVARYLQAVGDAMISGARWVVALDQDLEKRLLAREAAALQDWQRIGEHLRYFEDHKEWRRFGIHGQLALIQDASSGALLSGGILDMIAVKHTPVRPVAFRRLSDQAMRGALMAVNVDPAALSDEHRETLRRFTRGGGTLLSAPPGWKFPPPDPERITLGENDIETLDQIWKEVNSMTGRRNLGARLFNVASMLSNLLVSSDGKQLVLHLVNYSDYPVENITAHVLGKYQSAQYHSPGNPVRKLELYAVEEGTGIDIDRLSTVGTLVLR